MQDPGYQGTILGGRRESYVHQAGGDHDRYVTKLSCGFALLLPQDRIETILFGSCARGDADPESDIDVLFFVGVSRHDISEKDWQIGDLATELLLEHGIMVSPLVENRDHSTRNLQALPSCRSVECEG